MPDTNSGIALNDRPMTEMIRSVGLSYLSAAITPPRILSGTTITNATSASLSEF